MNLTPRVAHLSVQPICSDIHAGAPLPHCIPYTHTARHASESRNLIRSRIKADAKHICMFDVPQSRKTQPRGAVQVRCRRAQLVDGRCGVLRVPRPARRPPRAPAVRPAAARGARGFAARPVRSAGGAVGRRSAFAVVRKLYAFLRGPPGGPRPAGASSRRGAPPRRTRGRGRGLGYTRSGGPVLRALTQSRTPSRLGGIPLRCVPLPHGDRRAALGVLTIGYFTY